MKFENVRNQKSGHSIVIDFQTITVHTSWYVLTGALPMRRVLDLS
jgi:hypothetical protein